MQQSFGQEKFILSEEGRDRWRSIGTYFADPTYVMPEGMKTLDEVRKLTWLVKKIFFMTMSPGVTSIC